MGKVKAKIAAAAETAPLLPPPPPPAPPTTSNLKQTAQDDEPPIAFVTGGTLPEVDEEAEKAAADAAWESVKMAPHDVVAQVVKEVQEGFAACLGCFKRADDDEAEEPEPVTLKNIQPPWAKLVAAFNRVGVVRDAPEERRNRMGNAYWLLNFELAELESLARRNVEALSSCQMKNAKNSLLLSQEAFELCLNPPSSEADKADAGNKGKETAASATKTEEEASGNDK